MPAGMARRAPATELFSTFKALAHDRDQLPRCELAWSCREPGEPHTHRCRSFEGHPGKFHRCNCGASRHFYPKHSPLKRLE